MPTLINTLYPPMMPTFAPAFVNTEDVKVYYSLSPYNEYTKIQRVHIAVINQKNNETALENPNGIITQEVKYDTSKGMYYIIISPKDIKDGFGINQFYKVQVRFDTYEGSVPNDIAEFNVYLLEKQTYFSEWSQICLIKPILRPSILLRSFDDTDSVLAFNKGIIPISGQVFFGDGDNNETETLQSYKIQVLDGDNVVLETPSIYTGGNINPNNINYKLDLQGLDTSINTQFTMRVTITTQNQYITFKDYEFQIAEFLEEESFNPEITIEVDNEDGIAHLHIENILTVFGTLHVKRGSSIDNFKNWEDISVTRVAGPINMDIYDNTIGSLVWYRYSVQLENSKGVLTPVYRSDKFLPDFYDVILSRGQQQLKIRFDYQLSGYKPIVDRAKFDTLGGKYPKFAENGILNYKSFSITGTLSAMTDDNHHFLNRAEYFGDEYQNYMIYNQENYNGASIGYKENDYNLFINEEAFNYNDHFWEREFREAALAWLNDGEPKLYRSMAEGNMAVMLMDVSLNPKMNDRRIWSFSATVYEIAEGTSISKLDSLGIYEIPNVDEDGGSGVDPTDPEEYVLVTKPGQLYSLNVPLEKTDITSSVILEDIIAKYSGVLKKKRPDEIYLKNVKLFFQNQPHPFIYRRNAGWLLAENFNWNELSETERSSLQMGYTFEMRSTESEGYTTFFVNSNGYYQIPEYIDVKAITFPQNNDIVTVEYVVVYKEKNKSNAMVSGTTVEKTLIGQELGVFQPNQYLGERIRSKYTFLLENQYTQRMQFWKGISLDVTPFAVASILYHGEEDYKEYLVGMTGVLHLLKNYSIDDLCFLGLKMNKKPKNRQPYLKNYEYVEDMSENYNTTDDVGMPKLNTVYNIKGNKKIYYQYQWYDFISNEDNTGLAKVPVEGTINYLGDIVRVSIG